jgi:outer membrane receptor protein involved in Fe transport
MTVAARLTNEAWKRTVTTDPVTGAPTPQATDWGIIYAQTFLANKLAGMNDYDAHNGARAASDATRPAPGSATWKNLFNQVIKKPIGADPIKAGGAKFLDRSDLYSLEGQYNLSEITKGFADVLVGANFRKYVLNSQGTLFADSAGAIGITEYGAYVQLSKEVTPKFKLIVSGRYDKNQNFKGKFTPRATATYKVSQNGTVRASFQTAYRFPSTQQQWINLDIGSNVRLLGANKNFTNYYKYNTNPIYKTFNDANNVLQVENVSGVPVLATLNEFKPESVTSYELGYKGLHANKKLLIDVYGYYGKYNDFIGRKLFAQSKTGIAVDVLNPAKRQIYSIPTNSTGKVTTYGWGLGLDYRLPMNFNISANLSSDILSNVDVGLISFFNSPKYRANTTLSNNAFGYKKRMGFAATFRWQDGFFYEGDFANGDVPSVRTVDAQFSYRLPAAKSLFKLGANNLFNQYYRSGFGNPMIGGLYYVSYAYNF